VGFGEIVIDNRYRGTGVNAYTVTETFWVLEISRGKCGSFVSPGVVIFVFGRDYRRNV
jgi:hypothetical protein